MNELAVSRAHLEGRGIGGTLGGMCGPIQQVLALEVEASSWLEEDASKEATRA